MERNRAWAARKTRSDAAFFNRLSDQQKPAYFWIGCSDSRVPATEIVDLEPGEMFVHRNVANLALHGDPNFEAALSFAVDDLRVRHVLVVGHYGCGGIQAACEEKTRAPAVGHWLRGPRSLEQRHAEYLSSLSGRSRMDRLCELNVLAQAEGLASHPVINQAWRSGREICLHAWIYSLADGLIAQLRDPICSPGRSRPANV